MGWQLRRANWEVLLSNHWSSHRLQIVKDGIDPDSASCTCDAHAVRKQTGGGDTLC